MKVKRIIKIVGLVLAGVAALALCGFGVKAIVDYTKEDLKTISPSFEVGNLGSDGKFVNDESTLYTKEAFACYGLQVKPDFDSTVNYKIFYYDILDNYISSTEILSDGYSAEAPVNGAYARMVIEPRDDEDGKISWTERISYPKQLTLKVKKNQDINNRFSIFKGQVMQVVSDTNSLVFVNGLLLDLNELTWLDDVRNAVTSTTILKVKGGSTVEIDFAAFSSSHSNMSVKLYEFSDLPLNDNFTTCYVYGHNAEKAMLSKTTKYLIVGFSTNATEEVFSEPEVARLNSLISFTK